MPVCANVLYSHLPTANDDVLLHMYSRGTILVLCDSVEC